MTLKMFSILLSWNTRIRKTLPINTPKTYLSILYTTEETTTEVIDINVFIHSPIFHMRFEVPASLPLVYKLVSMRMYNNTG